MAVNLQGQSHIVTGANAGIGRVLSEALAARGATVHMVCRNVERGQQARDAIIAATRNPRVELHVVDIADVAQVKAFATQFLARDEPLTCLVNNDGFLAAKMVITAQDM